MSLTSFLEENADVREYFRSSFLKPGLVGTPYLIAPPRTKNASLIGTAFDYLLRWKVQAINPDTVEERDHWVADSAVARLPDRKLQIQAIEILRKTRLTVDGFLNTGNLSDDLMAAAVSLARLDVVFRTRGGYADKIGEPVSSDDIADLHTLVTSMPVERFRAKTKCFLNPTFGNASHAIEGADADLVIDDLLLEIKVRKEAAFRTEDFHQLVGYYLLYELGGIDGIYHLPRITRIGFYSARYALFTAWPVSELVDSVPIDRSVEWLRTRLGMDKDVTAKKIKRKARP